MPQFDFLTFFSQILGILFFLSFYYFFILAFLLPKVGEILKLRGKLLSKAPKGSKVIKKVNLFELYVKQIIKIIFKL